MKGKIKSIGQTEQEENTSSSETSELKQQIEQLESQLKVQQEKTVLSSDENFRYYQIQMMQIVSAQLAQIAVNLEKVGRVIEASSTEHSEGEDEDDDDEEEEEAPMVRKKKSDDEEDED